MHRRTRCALLLLALCGTVQGCIAVGVGRGNHLTVAEEIKALHKARSDGEITCEEYNLGIAALHTRTPQE